MGDYTAKLRQETYTKGTTAMTGFTTKGSQLTKKEHDDTHMALFEAFELRTLAGDTDVAITTPASKEILIYDSTWKNKTVSGDAVISVSGALTVSKIGGDTIALGGGSLTLSGAHALTLTTIGATDVTLPTTGILATTTLAQDKMYVGNASNIATALDAHSSSDITYTYNAAGIIFAIRTGVIVNADINTSAAISFSKMENLTAGRALYTDASGDITASTITQAELETLNSSTTNIATTFTGIISGGTTLTNIDIDSGNIDGVDIRANSLVVDDITVNGNTITTTGTGANLTIDVDNTGTIELDGSGGGSIQIGKTSGDKIGAFMATPIVQPTTGIAEATLVGGSGSALTSTDTFGGYTIAQGFQALLDLGFLA